jgi:UTP:GlnB (protein PII) uridylyltransferase
LQIAAHLDVPERARALYLLTLARDQFDRTDRARLDELYQLIQAALARPELTSLEARNLLQRRRAEAIRLANATPDSPLANRVEQAPRAFALDRSPADLIRAVTLLDSLPAHGAPRVDVTPLTSEGGWLVDVVARNRPALLAAVAAVLAGVEFNVGRATAATWPDGGTVVSLDGDGPQPQAQHLADRLRSLADPTPSPVVDARVDVDNEASPWYSVCTVRAKDRPGLLAGITAALFASGAEVHTASVETAAGDARDSFELADPSGRKLTPDFVHHLGSILAAGSNAKPVRRRGRTKLLWN